MLYCVIWIPFLYWFCFFCMAESGSVFNDFFFVIFLDLLFLVAVTSTIFVFSECKKFAESYLRKKRKKVVRADSTKSLISLV